MVTLQFAFKLLSAYIVCLLETFWPFVLFVAFRTHCATFDRVAARSLALPFARSNYVVTISLLGHILPHTHTLTHMVAAKRYLALRVISVLVVVAVLGAALYFLLPLLFVHCYVN